MLGGVFELLGELLFATRFMEQAEVECDQLGPVDCLRRVSIDMCCIMEALTIGLGLRDLLVG